MTATTLTAETLAYFLELASDSCNWGEGVTLVGGNVDQGTEQNGYLTACKKAGLLTTFREDGDTWAKFTEAGVALAASNGVEV